MCGIAEYGSLVMHLSQHERLYLGRDLLLHWIEALCDQDRVDLARPLITKRAEVVAKLNGFKCPGCPLKMPYCTSAVGGGGAYKNIGA